MNIGGTKDRGASTTHPATDASARTQKAACFAAKKPRTDGGHYRHYSDRDRSCRVEAPIFSSGVSRCRMKEQRGKERKDIAQEGC